MRVAEKRNNGITEIIPARINVVLLAIFLEAVEEA